MNQNSLTGSFQNHLYIPCRVGITLIFGVDCDASVMEQVYVVDATKLSVRCIVGTVILISTPHDGIFTAV